MTIPASHPWWTICFAEQHAEQEWLHDLQKAELNAFIAAGLPTRKDERWKYTDMSFLEKKAFTRSAVIHTSKVETITSIKRLQKSESIFIVLINGHFSAKLSKTGHVPAGVVLCSIRKALETHPDLVKKHLMKEGKPYSSFASLNMALMTDGVFLYIPKNLSIDLPVHFLYLNAHQNHFVSSPRNIIIAEANSHAVILEEHHAQEAENYFSNIVTDIHAQENAQIYYHKIQAEDFQSTHISQIYVQQQKDSVVKLCVLAVGGNVAREDVYVHLTEPGAQSSVNGFYVLNTDEQHLDNHIQIDHIAPHGSSEMMYKGVLDKKTHAVFNGKILVHPEAQKTHSHQANHNLILSPHASVDTKPELEIYADDVKCSHGDTVGQLDVESLFYLRSRGLDKHTALKLLTYAFAAEVMDRINHPEIKQRMIDLLNEKLVDDN
jgi:Fe-S cluster assembly protein SufD